VITKKNRGTVRHGDFDPGRAAVIKGVHSCIQGRKEGNTGKSREVIV
jgi:hypothetical protein